MNWTLYAIFAVVVFTSCHIHIHFDDILRWYTSRMNAQDKAVFYMKIFGKAWHDHL